MKEVTAKMKENGTEFEETFEIPTGQDATKHIKRILVDFNETREKKYRRELISIGEEQEVVKVYDWVQVTKDASKFMYYAGRQNSNAYGNAGIKANYNKIQGAHSNFLRGIFGQFISLVKDHGASAYDDMTALSALTKEKYKELRAQYKKQK